MNRLIVCLLIGTALVARAADRLNILLILVDDLGFADLGWFCLLAQTRQM